MRRYKRSVILMFVALFMVALGVPNIIFASDYENHWAKEAIQKWYEKGIVVGYEDGDFKPSKAITNKEFSVILGRVFNLPDTDGSQFMYDGGEKLIPQDSVTREQASYAIAKAYKISGASSNNFVDKEEISKWASDSVSALAEHGFISGYPDGSFGPKRVLTRADLVAMLDKVTLGLGEYQISGVVTHEGRAMKDVYVDMWSLEDHEIALYSETDENGKYMLDKLLPNYNYQLVAWLIDDEGFGYQTYIDDIMMDSNKTINIDLEKQYVASILVTDKNNRPIITGVDFAKVMENGEEYHGWDTNEEGYATIFLDAQDSSAREFNLYMDGIYVGNLNDVKPSVDFKSEYTVKLDLSLEDIVEGKAVYADMTPAKGVPIHLYKFDPTKTDYPTWDIVDETITDDLGEYLVEIPDSKGDYVIDAHYGENGDFFASQKLNALLGGKDNALILEKVYNIHLKVEGIDELELSDARVKVIDESGGYHQKEIEADGSCIIHYEQLIPRDYQVEVTVGDRVMTKTLTIRPEQYNYTIEFK